MERNTEFEAGSVWALLDAPTIRGRAVLPRRLDFSDGDASGAFLTREIKFASVDPQKCVAAQQRRPTTVRRLKGALFGRRAGNKKATFFLRFSRVIWSTAVVALLAFQVLADSDPAHMQKNSEKPQPWPGGVIPYDISKLTAEQQLIALRGMQRWMDTGAKISFIPRTKEVEYVNFTGKTDAGNNTTFTGFKKGARNDVNITAFWWRQQEWMPAHELGHVLGFSHEHQRWDRDQYVTIHYENIKPGRADDYDWIPKTNCLANSLPYDFRSIMHYRICWASKCEDQCKDMVGSSPCSVIEPVDKQNDSIIGQWTDNGISALDAERVRIVYGAKEPPVAKH